MLWKGVLLLATLVSGAALWIAGVIAPWHGAVIVLLSGAAIVRILAEWRKEDRFRGRGSRQ